MAQVGGACRRFKPHLLMTMAQIGYTILYFITEASFEQGLNPHVYITYRHIVATVVMWPFAYFLERYMVFKHIQHPSPLPETVSHGFSCSLSQKITAKAHMEIVSGAVCSFLSGGQPNSKHVLRELKVHLPDLRRFHGQHHCCHDLCHRRSAQVNSRILAANSLTFKCSTHCSNNARLFGLEWSIFISGVQEVWRRLSNCCLLPCCSITGGLVVIIGLYSVLWGKERDQEKETMSPEDASFVAPGKETRGSQDTFKNMCGKADNTKGSEVV
ncbi:hypothetical protein BHM03_00037939 [Ensete ventricosum]|uniref:WAT1-related protein n=1 Tax=Ensete ventricosum TaxID=4639 RepID=A0A426XJU2_ENSVE|nr:hypothetical protein B296_00058428 [Ensete ventricosum]RZS07155.1 hypothetical protein BHM03_00037939 [Ensete ventricosum]